jgi:hypothetical protein
MDSFSGTSPFASLAGVAQTPEAAPVGSGQGAGVFGSGLVAVKYAGNFGAGAAGAGAPGAAGASAFGASTAGAASLLSSAANETAAVKRVHSSSARNATTNLKAFGFIIPPLLD